MGARGDRADHRSRYSCGNEQEKLNEAIGRRPQELQYLQRRRRDSRHERDRGVLGLLDIARTGGHSNRGLRTVTQYADVLSQLHDAMQSTSSADSAVATGQLQGIVQQTGLLLPKLSAICP